MPVEIILNELKKYNKVSSCFTDWRHIPAKSGIYEEFPEWVDDRLVRILKEKGIDKLYSHQASALELIRNKNNVVVVTPTASGKTLCYNLPVLDSILRDENSRALYLFPTKALSQDQLTELYQLVSALDERIRTYNYPQGRITDHRIGLTLYKLEEILEGDLDDVIDALITTEQSEKLGAGADDEE